MLTNLPANSLCGAYLRPNKIKSGLKIEWNITNNVTRAVTPAWI